MEPRCHWRDFWKLWGVTQLQCRDRKVSRERGLATSSSLRRAFSRQKGSKEGMDFQKVPRTFGKAQVFKFRKLGEKASSSSNLDPSKKEAGVSIRIRLEVGSECCLCFIPQARHSTSCLCASPYCVLRLESAPPMAPHQPPPVVSCFSSGFTSNVTPRGRLPRTSTTGPVRLPGLSSTALPAFPPCPDDKVQKCIGLWDFF